MKDIVGWVKIELMSMDSDPGYVASSGYQEAVLVEIDEVVPCGNDPEALWELSGEQIGEEHLSDLETRSRRSGVLNYNYVSGIYAVPEGHIVVQRRSENICTHNHGYPERHAWVVNEASLLELYEERAKEYRQLAEAARKLVSKKVGFGEFKALVRAL